VMNAVEAADTTAESQTEVLVTSLNDENQVTVAIRDSGVGIDPKNLDQLFNPFFTTKPHGMGMGLPISRSTIESHGGRLWATSNPSRGATFQFTLPAQFSVSAA
jgi:signal transduction histidine kinase